MWHKVLKTSSESCSFFLCLVRSKGLAPPVAPRATNLRWVAMCRVAMQLWVCAESNYLCKHRVTLNTHPQSTIASTTLPVSVTSRLLRTFESSAVHTRKYKLQSILKALYIPTKTKHSAYIICNIVDILLTLL